MSKNSIGGARYFVTFIDDKTRKTFVYFLKSKDEVFAKFKEFKSHAEKQTGKRIKILRSDNGGEYTSAAFDRYLKDRGIQHQKTVPYTPEQNGVAERANRTIVERARCMILEQDMDKEFWAEAISTSTYLKNRSPTRALSNQTPEEAWSGKKPTLAYLRPFGCKAYAHVPIQKRSKLDTKTVECIMMGYSTESKAYRVFDPIRRTILITRDVVFDESEKQNTIEITEKKGIDTPDQNSATKNDQNGPKITIEPIPDSEQIQNENLPSENPEDDPVQIILREIAQKLDKITNGKTEELRRSSRESKKPDRYGEHPQHAKLAIAEPRSYKEAMSSESAKQWEQAAKLEMETIEANKTWTLVDLPPNRKSIGCRWLFKVKYDAAGNIERHKARLVAKGYAQIYDIDYTETFAPVVKFNSIRTLLALAAEHNLDVHQMDVKAAYLNGDLDEEIYMEQAEGFAKPGQEQKVCRLRKAIYGLKQAGRSWYQKIDTFFEATGLTRTQADNCVYVKRSSDSILMVAIYVDDILIFANHMNEIEKLKSQLQEKFDMKDLGEAHYCLGIQIKRNKKEGWIRINQTKYIDDILRRFNMQDSKPISTPMDSSAKLSKESSPNDENETQNMKEIPYQNAVGSLMYAMLGTRPDIAYAVGAVSRYNSNPGESHWRAVKRIFRYLKGTRDLELHYGKTGKTLCGYSDADWAGDADDRRSTTGFTFLLGGGAITWKSQKQPTVALSTTEAEYMALCHSAKEAIWLKTLLRELGYQAGDTPTRIYTDNQGSMALAKNAVHHARTKHIDVRHHFIREKLEAKEITIEYCETDRMTADVLTKALARPKHHYFVENLGLVGEMSQN
jgi:hypothetical protein